MQARYLQDSLVPELVPPEPFNKIGKILEFPKAKKLPLEHETPGLTDSDQQWIDLYDRLLPSQLEITVVRGAASP